MIQCTRLLTEKSVQRDRLSQIDQTLIDAWREYHLARDNPPPSSFLAALMELSHLVNTNAGGSDRIRSLRRFLAEVFPREQDVEKGGLVALRYGSTFRRLYGHAAFSLAAFFMRMCGGALKGLPLRELVETLFDGIACHPFDVGGNSDATSRDAGKRAPNAELKALAVMHLPDLLQCFSEVSPVSESFPRAAPRECKYSNELLDGTR